MLQVHLVSICIVNNFLRDREEVQISFSWLLIIKLLNDLGNYSINVTKDFVN